VRLNPLLKLATLRRSPTGDGETRTHAMTRADGPTPSVEAILHAILPYRFVDHTHADAVLALMNSRDGETRIAKSTATAWS